MPVFGLPHRQSFKQAELSQKYIIAVRYVILGDMQPSDFGVEEFTDIQAIKHFMEPQTKQRGTPKILQEVDTYGAVSHQFRILEQISVVLLENVPSCRRYPGAGPSQLPLPTTHTEIHL